MLQGRTFGTEPIEPTEELAQEPRNGPISQHLRPRAITEHASAKNCKWHHAHEQHEESKLWCGMLTFTRSGDKGQENPELGARCAPEVLVPRLLGCRREEDDDDARGHPVIQIRTWHRSLP